MKSHALTAGAAMFFGAVAFAAVKPLAIWNGEFETKVSTTRNDVTLSPGTTLYKTQYIQVIDSGIAPAITGSGVAQAIIANISNLAKPTNNERVIFGCYANNQDQYWLLLGTDGKITADKTSTYSSESFTKSTDMAEIDSGMHSYGMFFQSSILGRSYGFFDGECVHENSLWAVSTLGGLRIGGRQEFSNPTRKYNLADARISYIAVFPYDPAPSLEDFKTWSLYEMTNAETVVAGETIAGGARVGVNLLGGTYKVEGATAAHALFVQENSTIEFANASSLALAGPVYIARNRELTLTLSEGASSASLTSPHFADEGQITVAQGITVSAPEPSALEVADDVAAPVEFSGGDLGIWMKTKPNYWYAPVVGTNPEEVKDSVSPSENPVKATDDKTKITVPYNSQNVMYYKIISAASQEDFETAD